MRFRALWFVLGVIWLGTAGGASVAMAQDLDPLLQYQGGSDFLPSTPSVTGGALGAYYNPAAWATTERTEYAFWWNDQNIRENSLDNWGMSFGHSLGFSMQSRTVDLGASGTGRVEDYQIGIAGGDRRAVAGMSWKWSAGDNDQLQRGSGLSLGTIIRPSRTMSIGLSGFFENAYNPQEGILDVGVRPFGRSWLTLFGDYSIHHGQTLDEGNWGAGAEVRPILGLHAGVRFRDADAPDDFSYQVYAGVALNELAFFGKRSFAQHGDPGTTDYVLRFQPPFASLPLPQPGGKNRIVPIDLENKTLTYQKARWFDDQRVTWLGLVNYLETLRRDDSIRGVALNLSGLHTTPELQWELRSKLSDLKKSGKTVAIHADRLDMGGTYLASVADRLSLDPEGQIFLPGLAVERTYMRGLLDKLGIGVEEWRYFTHKTAFQTLSRKDMSDADKEQLGRLVDVAYETWRDGIAEGRHLTPSQVEAPIEEEVMLTPSEAKTRGLIDEIGRWPDLIQSIDKEKGVTVGAVPENRRRRVLPDERWGLPPEIAIVYAVGPCEMDSGIRGRATGKYMAKLAKNRDVAAVVLRADSPGGDPLPSDLVAEGTRKLKEAKKPVVVSQGSVAASGGYWISMDGTRILTSPLTITGSIGVIAGWLWDNGVSDKTGFTADGVQRGSHADLFSGIRFPIIDQRLPLRNLNDKEKERTKAVLLEVYDDFVGKVAAGRHMPPEKVREIGEGRIWMGQDAIQRGLADATGTLENAVMEARLLAGIRPGDEVRITEYPKPPRFPKIPFLPELPDVGILGRLAGSRATAERPESGDYGLTYFRLMSQAPAQPLLLVPVEAIPDTWVP
jgi:protease IV